MTINLQKPDITELKPKITVFGVGGGGGNAVNNMINGGLDGVEFVVANTDAQALTMSRAEKVIQLGVDVTEGLGAGSKPDVGRAAAEECIDEICDYLNGTHMAFVTAGMGGGTGTGAAPVVARAAKEMGVLTVGVVTKPFHFEGQRRMRTADEGIVELQKHVDTLIVIPNQNLFRLANDKTTFADAFGMADQVLYSGVGCITDLMVKEGLINLDFADVRSVMHEMGKAMMGTGEASGEGRAMHAAEAAISNPLLDETSMRGAQGLLISITGGRDLTLFEVDEAATRIREEIDSDANIILGATFDEALEGVIRVSVVATGIDRAQEGTGGETIDLPKAVVAPKPVQRSVEASAPATGNAAPQVQKPVASAAPATATAAKPVTSAAAKPVEKPRSVEKDGVVLEPYRPASSLFNSPKMEEDFKNALEDEIAPEADDVFIPQAVEEPETPFTAPRIPDVGEFPQIAQTEISAKSEVESSAPAVNQHLSQQARTAVEHADDRGPIGLLKKLRTGLGGRDENQEHSQATQSHRAQASEPKVQAPEPAQRSYARPQSEHGSQQQPAARVDNNPYAPKKAHLDNTGRAQPAEPTIDEDQLDIPAFLRRQTN